MKLAKASAEEAETLLRWLQDKENAKFENAKDRPPAFSRVIYGFLLLVDQCCDPTKDYLDWKPGYAPADTDRYRTALEKIISVFPSDTTATALAKIARDALDNTP